MDIEQFMPNAGTVAAIEKDVATYNKRRAHEVARLTNRRPAVITIYVVGILVLAYAAYLATGTVTWFHYMLAGLGIGFFPCLDKWIRADADWTQQRFRDHMLPVMFGFIQDFRYSHGAAPRSFDRLPREMVPSHNRTSFDDMLTGTIEGARFELCEMKLAQKSKNSDVVVFQGVMLQCSLRTPFPGTLVATRKIGDFKRFFRDLFGRGGLSEIVSGDGRLDDLYEFRTDRRGEARRLLAGPLGEMLNALWREWPGDTAQVGIRDDDVFLMLPTSRNFFELPSIDAEISYATDLAPMMRQIARFLSIAAMVPALDGGPPAPVEAAPVAEPQSGPATGKGEDADFVPLLDPVEPPAGTAPPAKPGRRKPAGQGKER